MLSDGRITELLPLLRWSRVRGAGHNRWTESETESDATYGFREVRRDHTHVFIRDTGREYTRRLHIQGGWSSISADREKTWARLYPVEEATALEASEAALVSPIYDTRICSRRRV